MNNAVAIIISVVMGTAFGTIFAFLDHYMLLKALRKLTFSDDSKDKGIIRRVYILRYVINLVVLIFVFVIRDYLPFRWEYILIGTALGLTLPARFLAMHMGIEKKPSFVSKSRMTEPENIDDIMPEVSEDGRVIVDDRAFDNDED